MGTDDLAHDLLYPLRVIVVRDGEGKIHTALFLLIIVDDFLPRNLSVGDEDDLIINGLQLGVNQTDLINRAGHAAGFHVVPHSKGAGSHDRDAPRQIGQASLEGEGQCYTDDAQYCHQGVDREVQIGGYDQTGDHPHQYLEAGVGELMDGWLHLQPGHGAINEGQNHLHHRHTGQKQKHTV